MELTIVRCNICQIEKREINHWLVAITRPGLEGIMFVPAESIEEPRRSGYTYEDLCGQGCAHKRLSAWLGDLNNIDFPRKGSTP
jgi:hypothetical protein